ncbi:6-phosphogluconolactonase [Candidatus Pacearchaeota archaeon]|nr:6-phosphogluconolactonase [Candidatus Pacearchaeota archaeon]|tara:strand:- start:1565 stop:2245 length:681 start_codon:yes stop_codon:yes gene_type:complete
MRLIFGNKDLMEKRATHLIESKIKALLEEKEHVVLGIPGGTSVPGIFKRFLDSKIPWKKVHIFLVDDRKVAIFDSESNFKLARSSFLKELLEKRKIKKENIHAYNFQEPVSKYTKELKKYGGKFDIVLLSAGEDGHVASLFPKHRSIKSSSPYYIDVKNSSKPPKDRISASYSLLTKSKLSILLFFGEKKKEAYEKFINPKLKVKDVPAKLVNRIKESYVLTNIQS